MLQQGEVVAVPTETVYGLAADAHNDAAIQKIYAAKQRPANNPLIVHLAEAEQAASWAASYPEIARQLAAHFWPGPLTLVLAAQKHVLPSIRAYQPTVALRVPAHPLARQLLRQSGLALAAPSANKYTQLSPTSTDHVEAGLGTAMPVLDGGPCKIGIESTIVSVSGDDWQLLRHGMITELEIAKLIGKPALPLNMLSPKAPGQHALHYSPRTPCQLFASRSALLTHAERSPQCTALLFGEPTQPHIAHSITLPLWPEAAAQGLYAALHALDQQQATQILIESPPDTPTWHGILDRLQRAAYAGPHNKIADK